MKKLLYIIPLVLLLALLAACGAPEETTESPAASTTVTTTASPLEDFEFGESKTYSDGRYAVIKYNGNAENVVIPKEYNGNPICVIEDAAFRENHSVKTVHLPDTVTCIGKRAFLHCKNLISINFPTSLEIIKDYAFAVCNSLKKVDLSNTSLTQIKKFAFNNCTDISEVILCDTITEINNEAFSYCAKLEEIKLPKNLQVLGSMAFSNCISLKKVTIPPIKGKISWYGTFAHTPSVSEIVLEDGLERLGEATMFSECIVESVTIPESVKFVGFYTFYKFDKLKEIIFLGDAPQFGESELENKPFGPPEDSKHFVIYYDPAKSGWDTTVLKDFYTLKPTSER